MHYGSTLNVGRSNDYKDDSQSLHISDLKVPKKYITIITGTQELADLSRTPLRIRFESICTTLVNDTLYKLPTKDSSPIDVDFSEPELLIKVNANKSDRIRLRLDWKELNICFYLKRILFNGEVHDSPLREKLDEMFRKKLDFRICDIFSATHYLTVGEHVDFDFQVAVLRSLPVLSSDWVEYAISHSQDLESWLLNIKKSLFLQAKYTQPDSARAELLKGCNTVVVDDENRRRVLRMSKWLQCLQSDLVEILLKEEILSRSSITYVFSTTKSKDFILGQKANTSEDLWLAVLEKDLNRLTVFHGTSKEHTATSAINTNVELSPRDEKHPITVEEKISPRKRRKIVKVSEDDFFLFLSAAPTSQIEQPKLDSEKPVSVVNSQPITGFEAKSPIPVNPSLLVASEQVKDHNEVPKEQHVQSESFNSGPELQTAPAKRNASPTGDPLAKRLKSMKIAPKLSLAAAFKTAKQEAEVEYKVEEHAENVQGTAVVKEIELKARKKRAQATTDYEGRKNFKTFKKVQPEHAARSNQKKYLEMSNEVTSNELVLHNEKTATVNINFNEMGTVKGFQPNQLFLEEDSEDEDIMFRGKNAKAETKDGEDESSDDEVRFAFSRR